jgi:hypothetical protein
LLENRFPNLDLRVAYGSVEDIALLSPRDALAEVERRAAALLERPREQ